MTNTYNKFRIFSLLIMFFGVIIYSFLIGFLNEIVSEMDAKNALTNHKLQMLNKLKKTRKLTSLIIIKKSLRKKKEKQSTLKKSENLQKFVR